ncbi:MAG TPA: hypothetical protein VKY74_16970 [Chloroflexia bacterium]|nr:hypothetical protein [Chloroflexia bacterium]
MALPVSLTAPPISEELVDRVVAELHQLIGGSVPDAVLREQARAVLPEMLDLPIPAFLPIFAAQAVMDRLAPAPPP